MRPADVNICNEKEILLINKKRRTLNKKPSKYKIGNRVRISKLKKIVNGYLPNWTNEIFTIHNVKSTVPRTYALKDEKGYVLEGGFYEPEISRTKYGNVYLIEKILKTKGDKGFVRWLGYDKSHDTWIDKKNIV